LRDSSFAVNLNESVLKLKAIGQNVDSMALDLSKITGEIRQDISHGKGTLHILLKDSAVVIKLNAGLDNIVKGTDGFNQNMEALKHNFLFRGYFRRQEKQKAKEAEKQKKNPQ
jgi:phospholipid/cholesterol/gamma-HCH transport system substrate-binding protein